MIILIIIIIIYILLISIIEITSNFTYLSNKKNLINVIKDNNIIQDKISNLNKIEIFNNYNYDNFIGNFYYYFNDNNNNNNNNNVIGFYIYNNNFNLLNKNTFYTFNIPVNLKIINIRNEKLNIFI
jgi:hypothetical protein